MVIEALIVSVHSEKGDVVFCDSHKPSLELIKDMSKLADYIASRKPHEPKE